MQAQVITRRDAESQGLRHYFTGRPCKYGHVSRRFTKTKICLECNRLHSAAWVEVNREIKKRGDKRWRDANKERRREDYVRLRDNGYHREWYASNRASKIKKMRAFREGNRAYFSNWKKSNRSRVSAYSAARRAATINAMPSWVDVEAIIKFYENRPEGYTVDHIVPLQGRDVCGLHVPWNLQYLTQSENSSKGISY